MQPELKKVRKVLQESTMAEFMALVKAAKLLPLTEEILCKRILRGKSICQLAMELHVSESTVRRRLHEAYSHIAHTVSVYQAFHNLFPIVCIILFMQ